MRSCMPWVLHAAINMQSMLGPATWHMYSKGAGSQTQRSSGAQPCRPTCPATIMTAPALHSAGASLEMHQPTVARMQEHYDKRGIELNSARLRMATLPTPAEVLFTEGIWVPLVNINSVYILPGIPRLFQSMITAHQVRRRGGACACSMRLLAASSSSRWC